MSRNKNDTRERILLTAWQIMEKDPGCSLSMGQIAKASGISRQAVYLHFSSRTELLIAVTHYVDEVKGLDQRLAAMQQAQSGEEQLQLCVEIWGNYMPEIYSVAKALLMTRDNDEAAAAAWDDVMGCLRDVCSSIVQRLANEQRLNPAWQQKQAIDYFWTAISIGTWEQLTRDCGWSTEQFIEATTNSLRATLIRYD